MLIVRPARRDDIDQLVPIYNHYVEKSNAVFDTEPVSLHDRLEWFKRFSETGPYRLMVAVDGERVLGCAASSPYRLHKAFAKTVELGIYLDPNELGRAVGTTLYQALLDELGSESLHLAVAAIALPNPASIALHRKFGFTEVGVFDEYATKNGAYISSLWMQRRLDTPG